MTGPLSKNSEFRFLVGARFLLSMALQSQAVLIGWLVYELTKDPLYLGLIGLTEAIPAIGLALYSGHLVDRGRPFAFYRNAVLTCMGCSAALAFLASGPSQLPRAWILPLTFAVIFVVGIARSFMAPSLFSLIPRIVPRQSYASSSAWLTSAIQLASVIGPAAAGFAFPLLGGTRSFACVGLLSLLAFVSISSLGSETRQFQHPEENRRAPALGSMRAGLAFVFGTPLLLSALTLDMFSVLFGGATAVLPMFSDQLLHAGPMGLGLLRSAFSLGAVLMSIRLILRPMRTIRGSVLLAVVAGFGVTTVAFGFSRSLPLAMGMLFLCGAFDSVSMVIRSTILQLCTPDEMRGRVSSVNSIFIGSSNEIGAFESGVAARLLGLAPSIIFGGAMTLLIVGGTTTFSRALRKSVFKTG